MLECLSFKSLTPSSTSTSIPNLPPPPPPSQGNSTEDTPTASARSSPAPPNVSREFNRAVHANSFKEIQLKIQAPPQEQVHLVDVLDPDRARVQEALDNAKPCTLTRIVSTYFDNSENTCELFLLLHRTVRSARTTYAPIHNLLNQLPADYNLVTHSHCELAFNVFRHFDEQDNPFPSSDSPNFGNMCRCFSELKNQLDRRRDKSRSRIRLLRRATTGCALCFVVTAVGVVASAIAVAGHAAVALAFAAPVCTQCVIPYPKTTEKKELARLAQLDAALNATFVGDDLATIDSLVDRLHTAVEGDKALVRFALARGGDKHPIMEVLKHLRKNQQSFLHLIDDLEKHIYICITIVNKARLSLLEQISFHQTF